MAVAAKDGNEAFELAFRAGSRAWLGVARMHCVSGPLPSRNKGSCWGLEHILQKKMPCCATPLLPPRSTGHKRLEGGAWRSNEARSYTAVESGEPAMGVERGKRSGVGCSLTSRVLFSKSILKPLHSAPHNTLFSNTPFQKTAGIQRFVKVET